MTYALAIAAPGDISRVAGGSHGDGGLAIKASITNPSGVAIDSLGDIYIVDTNQNRIRKITAATGIITTIAGTGAHGFSGDGGSATSASLNMPFGVGLDISGNVYIVDTGNGRIRKVTVSTGVITTVAGSGLVGSLGDGGAAINASLNAPYSVALDSVGNIYIADTGNQRVRKVTLATGLISTVAGTGLPGFLGDDNLAISAQIYNPTGIALDALGNIYIAEFTRIRKVAIATGIISTVAGGVYQGFLGDGGNAKDAILNTPGGVSLDVAGNIYIADSINQRIRKVTITTGIITTVAGNGVAGYSGDNGAANIASLGSPPSLALDIAGNIYIADRFNYAVRKVTVATGLISTLAGTGSDVFSGDSGAATLATLNDPQGVASDSVGNIYIADTFNNRVRKVDASNGLITTIAGNGAFGFSGDGGPAITATLQFPIGIALDASGNIYFTTTSQHLRKITVATGIITTIAGNGMTGFEGDGGLATNAKLGNPLGIAIDGAGNIYIAEGYNARVRKVTAATGIITTIAGGVGYGFSGDGGPAISARIYGAGDVAIDNVGNIYITDIGNHRIRKITAATGIITTVAGTGTQGFSGDGGPATAANLDSPFGIAVDKSGNIFFSDSNARIRKITASTGAIATVAGTGVQGFSGDSGPARSAQIFGNSGVSLDNTGNLYVADYNRIRKISGPIADSVLRLGNDLSADGKSDLIFRNAATGQISAWLMNGTTVTSSADLLSAGSGWTATHTADFNGDGRADILWRHTDGSIALWLMNGTAFISGAGLLGANSGWTVTHVADFNGDGRADILYRHTDGRVAMWLMNGNTFTSGAGLLNASSGWRVTHTGDFDGDGRADLLFSHTDGRVAMWLMNGTVLTSGSGLLEANSGWAVTHTGDFNGDGRADILYRHTDGRVAMWLMNGITLTSGAGLLNAGSGWTVTHTADFNGDGKADILYRHADGRVAIWLMNGSALTSGAGLLDANSGWSVTHTGDYNGDGKADILYRNTDGRIAMWLMNGVALMSGAGITGPGSLVVVPPIP